MPALFLTIALPLLLKGVALGLSLGGTAWLIAKATGLKGWVVAHTKTNEQKAALDKLSTLALGAFTKVLGVCQTDLGSGGVTTLIPDVLAALKASISPDDLKQLVALGLGVTGEAVEGALENFLHIQSSHPVVGNKVFSIQSSAGMSLAQKRAAVDQQGVAKVG